MCVCVYIFACVRVYVHNTYVHVYIDRCMPIFKCMLTNAWEWAYSCVPSHVVCTGVRIICICRCAVCVNACCIHTQLRQCVVCVEMSVVCVLYVYTCVLCV